MEGINFDDVINKFLFYRNCMHRLCEWSKIFFSFAVVGKFTAASLFVIIEFYMAVDNDGTNLIYIIVLYGFALSYLLAASALTGNLLKFTPSLIRFSSKSKGY